jgi:hypothetical protein
VVFKIFILGSDEELTTKELLQIFKKEKNNYETNINDNFVLQDNGSTNKLTTLNFLSQPLELGMFVVDNEILIILNTAIKNNLNKQKSEFVNVV